MDKFVEKILSQISKYAKKLKDFQDQCNHEDYEKIKDWNDHDGYSWVEIDWYQDRKCNICSKYFTVHTGKTSY